MALVTSSIAGTFVWDRLCVFWFARDIFDAQVASLRRTTFAGDVVPLVQSVGKICMGITSRLSVSSKHLWAMTV